jgi:hypothetical protein
MVTTSIFREAPRRADSEWLAGVSLVHLTDEGRIQELAEAVARGANLA